MAVKTIETPDFDFSGFYYPEILRALIQYQRVNVPEVTDESDEEPFQQLLRSYALVGHLNNVLLDVTATESLLPTSRLLESVRGHLALIGYKLSQASPSVADVVLEFSKTFDVTTTIVPERSRFGTEETSESPQILFENIDGYTIDPTNKPTAVFSFNAAKIKILNNTFDAGDQITVDGVAFAPGSEFSVGATIADTLANLAEAINTSSDPSIVNRIFALNDGVDEIQLIPLDPTLENFGVVEVDNATDNFEIQNAAFGSNKAGSAVTPGVTFDMFTNTPKPGDAFYVSHKHVMWDAINLVFSVIGSGVTGVWEFYDGNTDDEKPDSVTNLGSNLKLDLTTLLGDQDRTGTIVKVVLTSSGASELVVSKYEGGKNVAYTKGLLGQVSITTDEQGYVVGSLWNEVNQLTDNTNGFTEDGSVTYELPQNLTQNWGKAKINSVDGHWLRFRVISVTNPVNPEIDEMNITEDKQYLLVSAVQGQTVAEAPLGSSNGAADQKFTLTFKPLIEGSLEIEVDEGSGFEPWNSVDNFLNSTSQTKDYKLEIKGNDEATITFGDGKRGKIPSPGVDNIRAIYRIGADVNGNVGAETIKVNKSGISFVNRVFNPRQASGWTVKEGSTEEDLARVKIEGPASIRTLERAITPEDIEFLARNFTDSNGSKIIERAKAIEETFGVKTIELVVVGQAGAILTEDQKEDVQNFFNGSKTEGIEGSLVANHEVNVVNYTPREINVDVTVTGGNAATITNAIKALLNPSATFNDGVTKRWGFGAEVPFTVIISAIFEVDPVNIKKVDLTTPSANVSLGPRELPLAGNIQVTIV